MNVRAKLKTGAIDTRILYRKLKYPGDNWFSVDVAFSASAIAYGSGVYVAIAGSPNAYYSYDGENWDVTALPALMNIVNNVEYVQNLGLFIASSINNRLAYSPDGVNWTLCNAPATSAWGPIVDATDTLGKVFCYGVSGSIALSSTDGINWTQSPSPAVFGAFKGAIGGGKIAVTAPIGGGSIFAGVYRSTDGLNFTQVYITGEKCYSIVYSGGAFIMVGDDSVMKSTDLITWTPISCPAGAWRYIAQDVARGRLIVSCGSGTKRIMKSEDNGNHWTLVNTPDTTFGQLVYNPDDGAGKYAALGANKVLISQ